MASRAAVPQCLLYLLALTPLTYADDLTPLSEYEGKAVVHVRFDPPTQPLPAANLTRLAAVSEGTPLHLADVRGAIKRLYGTGEYTNIEVDTEPAPGGVSLIFRTNGQWFVGPVEVRGKLNLPPNSGQLVGATRLDLGTAFNDADVDTAVDNLRSLLQRNGLYRGTITPKIERDPQHQEVSITFEVNSGKRARYTLPSVVGDTKLPADEVAHAAKYKEILFFPWKPVTQARTQAGLQNIRSRYEKRDRLTATVTLEKTDYLSESNRIRPTIRAEGGPVININAEGAKVSKGTLQRYVPVFDEATANQDLLVSGARNLRDYFQNRGYFDVQVDLASHDKTPDLEVVTYTVGLGDPHRLVRVDVKGNRYFTTAQIRERMFLQPKGFIRLRRGRYSESFADRDGKAIQALYRDSGFRDCKVSAKVVDTAKGKKGDVAITLTIEEGPQYLVSNLAVHGMTLKDRDAILSALASASGQPFSETAVAMDRDYILEHYQAAGYPSAEFNFRAIPAGPNAVNLLYNITEGAPQYVRDVVISGLRTSRHRLVDPLFTLHAGDPLSWNEMGRIQRHLYNLGVFDKVDMAIQNPDGDTDTKFVDFHLVEGHLYSMAVGVGAEIVKIGGSATSISNPTGITGFAPRFDLELSRRNLWGLDQSVTLKGRYSTLDRRVALNYEVPRFHNREGQDITWTALYDNTRDVLTFTAVKYQGGIQVSERLDKATKIQFRYSWTDVRVDPSTLKISPLLIPLYSQPSQVGLLGVNLVQDRRDDAADAHHGIYNSLDLGLASHPFGGNKNFGRMLVRNSYYKRLPSDFVLASNTEFGAIGVFHTGGIPTTQYIPLPERFFGGGDSSMRGFPFNQAGPRDPDTGFPLGGNALLFHSTELRFPFIGDNIFGVFFHDMGNVYTSLGSVSFRVHQNNLKDFDYMVHAVGFGIRYRTPVGPIRVDLAYSINPPTFNGLEGTYQQLLFGGATKTVQNVSHFQFFFSVGQAF